MNNFRGFPGHLTCRTFAVHVGVFFLIAASEAAVAQRSPGEIADADVLPAILRAAVSDAGRGDWRVDPRPLKTDVAYLYEIQPEAMEPVSAAVVDGRAAIIRAVGLRTADTMVVNQSRNCLGALVISQPDSLGRVDDKRVFGCPEERFAVLAVGPLRPGSATISEDKVYDRVAETAARGYWAARVIRTTFGQGRSSAYAADYILAARAGKWVVIKSVGLMYSE